MKSHACSGICRRKRLFIIRNDAISSHILCLNNFFTFEFKRKSSGNLSAQIKRSFHHTKISDISGIQRFSQMQNQIVCKSFLRRLRRFHLRLLCVFMTVAFAMNSTHLRTSHQNLTLRRSMRKEAMSYRFETKLKKNEK